MIDLKSEKDFENFINNNEAVLVYFSTPQCSVCKVLKPKIKEFISEEFTKIKIAYLDCELLKEVSAQNRIFAVPTILVFFNGKEYFRKSRNISISEFHDELKRPYSMFFDN
jgi:thioredoxin-like negative regulator of GroEL